MLPSETRNAIREAFLSGTLQVDAVDPFTGLSFRTPISDVCQHHTTHKNMVKVTLEDGRDVSCTVDHSLFRPDGIGVTPIAAGELQVGSAIVTVADGQSCSSTVTSVETLPPEEHTYDLCVPGPENFLLSNGILAHNSYSIGGVSLELNRSAQYETLKQNSESQFDKGSEAKARTVKYMRGLQQPKYGVGIRSSFGPQVGAGVLSPRGFL